jgi:hypothetical protein
MNVVIIVLKVRAHQRRARYDDRRSKALNMYTTQYWPHLFGSVNCNEPLTYAALIGNCIDCGIAESNILTEVTAGRRKKCTDLSCEKTGQSRTL